MEYKKPIIKILDSSTNKHLLDKIEWGGSNPPTEGDAKRGIWEDDNLEENTSFNIWHQE